MIPRTAGKAQEPANCPHFPNPEQHLLDIYFYPYDTFTMNYRINLFQTDEGWAVSCPELPGCHSQGQTRDEAVEQIKEAIRLWLDVEAEETGLTRMESAEVAI